MNPRFLAPLLLLLLISLAAPGCGDGLDVKRGVEGEACAADNDCRDDLICSRRECAPLGAANNGGFQLSCEGVCDRIESCNIDEANCVSDCQSETRAWSEDGTDRVFNCLLDLSCSQLGMSSEYNACKERRFEGGGIVNNSGGDPGGGSGGGSGGSGGGSVDPGGSGGVAFYRYVLIEDLSSDQSGDAPGADVDGVCVEKDGVEFCAETVEDFNIGGATNAFTDTTEVLGFPDSGCEKQNFLALGGAESGSYVMLGFGDVLLAPGDLVVVYELGSNVCPNQPNWNNDFIDVSISASVDLETFEFIGVVDDRQNVIPVP